MRVVDAAVVAGLEVQHQLAAGLGAVERRRLNDLLRELLLAVGAR